VFALGLLAVLIGCYPTFRIGTPPRTNQLDTLKLGDSTKADVLLALGQPQGDGATRFAPGGPTLRTIWFYDYTESDAAVIALKILLVFGLRPIDWRKTVGIRGRVRLAQRAGRMTRQKESIDGKAAT